MPDDPNIHQRRSIRLPGYNYSQPGAYFVTICTKDRECLFGDIVDGEMRLNEAGRMVADEWIKTGKIRPNITLDQWVIMPNHFHGIIVIHDNPDKSSIRRGTACRAPTNNLVNRFRIRFQPSSVTKPICTGS